MDPRILPVPPLPPQLPLEPSTCNSLFSSLGVPPPHLHRLAASLAAASPGTPAKPSAPFITPRQPERVPAASPANTHSGHPPRVLGHRRQAHRVGTQPQAHGCGRRKGSGLGDLALPITNQETEAGIQSASFEMSELVKMTHRVTISVYGRHPPVLKCSPVNPPGAAQSSARVGTSLKGPALQPGQSSLSVFIASPQKTPCWLSAQGALEG